MRDWRAYATHGMRFARDEIELFLLRKEDDGNHVATVTITVSDEAYPQGTAAAADDKPAILDRTCAEALYNALGQCLTGVAEPYQEIVRLRRELALERTRVDKLINGIGRARA